MELDHTDEEGFKFAMPGGHLVFLKCNVGLRCVLGLQVTNKSIFLSFESWEYHLYIMCACHCMLWYRLWTVFGPSDVVNITKQTSTGNSKVDDEVQSSKFTFVFLPYLVHVYKIMTGTTTHSEALFKLPSRMVMVHSALVITGNGVHQGAVKFYGSWCGRCRCAKVQRPMIMFMSARPAHENCFFDLEASV